MKVYTLEGWYRYHPFPTLLGVYATLQAAEKARELEDDEFDYYEIDEWEVQE